VHPVAGCAVGVAPNHDALLNCKKLVALFVQHCDAHRSDGAYAHLNSKYGITSLLLLKHHLNSLTLTPGITASYLIET
jgi:hypothetical protein